MSKGIQSHTENTPVLIQSAIRVNMATERFLTQAIKDACTHVNLPDKLVSRFTIGGILVTMAVSTSELEDFAGDMAAAMAPIASCAIKGRVRLPPGGGEGRGDAGGRRGRETQPCDPRCIS